MTNNELEGRLAALEVVTAELTAELARTNRKAALLQERLDALQRRQAPPQSALPVLSVMFPTGHNAEPKSIESKEVKGQK